VRALDLRPQSALAVYAHPDDADVAAGGLLAQWAAEGCAVHLVVVCDGAKGSHAPVDAATLREARLAELHEAADLLGAATSLCLEHPDGEVVNDDALRATLVGLIREHRPEVVLGPDPTAVFFEGVYINHHDHRETGWALLDAVAPAAAMPLYFPERGAAHQVRHLLLSGTHEPDVVADVSRTIDTKVKAVLAHVSQMAGDAEAIRRVVYERAAQAGRPVGVDYGEAFRSVDLAF
jgi:LmbE family N-acetylglucosaminyl deacetylase